MAEAEPRYQSAGADAPRGGARAARQPLGPRLRRITSGMRRGSAGAAPEWSEKPVRTRAYKPAGCTVREKWPS